MKTVILAGGRGTRLAEETASRPKPMIEIGGKPILWHIMKIYAASGINDFVVACGYKGEIIKQYFHNYFLYDSDFVIDLTNGSRTILGANGTDWKISLIDTGLDTLTAGRILALQNRIGGDTFMVTYGDGVGNIDIRSLLAFHRTHGKTATVTAVRPPARFGALTLDGSTVCSFGEKTQAAEGWINGGFFVFEPRIFDYLRMDESLEREPMDRLVAEAQLMAFQHEGFWQPMDTLREKQLLEGLWSSGAPPWKIWN
jgi:glucose-1-phosphate cytidylyltransferase